MLFYCCGGGWSQKERQREGEDKGTQEEKREGGERKEEKERIWQKGRVNLEEKKE